MAAKFRGWNLLPIELLNFSAEPDKEKVDLKWTTAAETNNKLFTIERSRDAMHFDKVADVAGVGNNLTAKNILKQTICHMTEFLTTG